MRIMLAATAALIYVSTGLVGAHAQSDRSMAEMRLYIQELEEQIRLLTGENERLLFELRQLQAATGADTGQRGIEVTGSTSSLEPNSSAQAGAPPQDLGTLIVSEEGADRPVAGEGNFQATQTAVQPGSDGAGAPVDLTALAGGAATLDPDPKPQPQQSTQQVSGLVEGSPPDSTPAGTPPQVQATLGGNSRQAYDVAYGYVLTGDYDVAERQFATWLQSFPGDPQAPDAQFWLGESQFQQGKNREAANTFLALYREAPASRKAPDALLKLGMSLAALGEKDAACSTFAEVSKRHPDAPAAVTVRVATEAGRADC